MSAIALFDHVRSHDFPDRPPGHGEPCFAEGVVVAIIEPGESFAFKVPEGREGAGEECVARFPDCARYAIRVTSRIFRGEPLVGEGSEVFIFPPVNGTTRLFGGVCRGVERVAA